MGGGESSARGGKRAVLETSRAVPPNLWKGTATTRVVGAGAATHARGGGAVDRVGIRTREDSVKGRRTAVARREPTTRVLLYLEDEDAASPRNKVIDVDLPHGYYRVWDGALKPGDLYLNEWRARDGVIRWEPSRTSRPSGRRGSAGPGPRSAGTSA
jgi:hypothetical protein